ncbi:MAG: response regulator [Desulfobulbaceae bacterium]|nr:response regulator [Desulfobulbaceae bacterium]
MTATLNTYSPDYNGAPPHILIMEDEEVVAKGLEMVLSEEGYNVDLAFTGEQALETFSSDKYDLLVADLRLPDVDGMEVIKKVKETQPETEVVVITGYSSVTSAVDAMKIGVFDYLTKPFVETEIKEAVHGALQKIHEEEARIKNKVAQEESKLIEKREVIRILDRTAEDQRFWTDLMENDSEVLAGYNLSYEAQAAIMSGDLGWINRNIGELTQKQLMFITIKCGCEIW